jgi:hypothetical protein
MNEWEKPDFLVECMSQNLEHARHVENERMTFISLLLVSIGMILEFSTNIDDPGMKLLMCAILLAMNFICTQLLDRWGEVFSGHAKIAEKIMRELDKFYEEIEPAGILSKKPTENPDKDATQDKLGLENKLYYFNNQRSLWMNFTLEKREKFRHHENSKVSREDLTKMEEYLEMEAKEDIPKGWYTSTARYFYWFNDLVYMILAAFFVTTLLDALAIHLAVLPTLLLILLLFLLLFLLKLAWRALSR